MPLFDQTVRTDLRLRRENESAFDYMNVSARPGIVAVRGLLEGWFAEVPRADARDIRSRFRSRTAVEHQGAFWELYLYTLLRRMGYGVQTHPALPNGVTTHPDFLATNPPDRAFYVEATQATPPRTDVAAERRISELYDSLNRMHSPNFFLEVQWRGNADTNIPGRQLRGDLEHWLATLNLAEIENWYRNQAYENIPRLDRTFEGLQLTFSPLPKPLASRGRNGVRPIAVQMPMGFKVISVHENIRSAVEGKAQKYGNLAHSLIVAINVDEDFFQLTDIANALFGDECVVDRLMPDGSIRQHQRARVHNGALYGHSGPKNRAVSAVIVTRRMSPTTLRSQDMWMLHNPYAVVPLMPEWLELPQIVPEMVNGSMRARAGRCAADILGIPLPWPIPD